MSDEYIKGLGDGMGDMRAEADALARAMDKALDHLVKVAYVETPAPVIGFVSEAAQDLRKALDAYRDPWSALKEKRKEEQT